jgi:predicted RNase H-like HicB family nuclease
MYKDEEDGKWWVSGVRPGAITESGNTPEEAFLRFRNTYKNVLFDFAEESRTYTAFKEAVESFYYQLDQGEEDRWLSALEDIRSGKVVPEPQFFSQLPKEAPETRPSHITVERLDKENARYNPTDNVPDHFAMPLAA